MTDIDLRWPSSEEELGSDEILSKYLKTHRSSCGDDDDDDDEEGSSSDQEINMCCVSR